MRPWNGCRFWRSARLPGCASPICCGSTGAAAKLPVWVRNGLRHSFASYHIAKWKDAAALALEMGHTTTKLIFSHYRALVHEDDAERYWKIFPASSAESANVVNFGGSPPSRRPAK